MESLTSYIIPWQRLKARAWRCEWEILFLESNEMSFSSFGVYDVTSWRHNAYFRNLSYPTKIFSSIYCITMLKLDDWKRQENSYFCLVFDDDVTWWRHNANFFSDLSSPSKNLMIDILHDCISHEIIFDPTLTPDYDVIEPVLGVSDVIKFKMKLS